MLRRPNAAPLQSQHPGGNPTGVRRRGPEESAGPQYPRNSLEQCSRLKNMFQQLRSSYHVQMCRGKRCFLKFTFKDFEPLFAHVLRGVRGNIEALTVPAVVACSVEQTTCTA